MNMTTFDEQEHYCSLCSHTFRGAECHSGCPFARGCKMIRCPRCGYEFVDESSVVNWFKRTFRKKDGAHAAGIDQC